MRAKAGKQKRASSKTTKIRPFYTEAEVCSAVERCRTLLRHRVSEETARGVILAWASIRLANILRPDDLLQSLRWDSVAKHADDFLLVAAGAMAADIAWGTMPLLSTIGAVQDADTVSALHRIWSRFETPPAFDFLGVTYMALLA